MKKPVYLILVVLVAYMLVACAGTRPKLVEPGGKIGDMIAEKHSPSQNFPDLYAYCGQWQTAKTEPGSDTIDCNIPITSRITIDFGWGTTDDSLLEANWDAMAWELHIDGYQINLAAFGPSDQTWTTGPGRGWTLDLVNPTLGKHILRVLWKTEISIDDGFDTYPAGTYEDILNFTVVKK